jgi:Bacterial Ig-like domain (group 2)
MLKITAVPGLRCLWCAASAVALVGCGTDSTTSAGTAPATTIATPGSITGPLAIQGTPPTTVHAGQAYSFTPVVVAPTGETLRFDIVNQPMWVTFNAATGQLLGTPTAAGTFAHIVISVEGGGISVSLPTFSIQVQAGAGGAPTLESIALSPVSLRLAPRSSQQLTLTGMYSDATHKPLPATDAVFQSSNSNVASVSAAGIVTIAANASVGGTATISATDSAGHQTTSAAASTLITVTAPTTAPTPNSAAAAMSTVKNNPLCGTPVKPFYWEIGDQNGALISGSEGSDSSGNQVLADTKLSIASASKWIYATYVVQLRGSADHLSAEDINFLHFTSGYTNMDNPGTACPRTNNPDTVNQCLNLTNANGVSYSAQDPATFGTFDYNGGHMENHASQLTGLGNVAVGSVGSAMQALLGPGITLEYTEPLMSGGILTSAQDYTLVLRHVLDGTLFMHDALGANQVCTHPSATCNATFSPVKEAWHYSIGHWVENDPKTNGDGAFSSPGAFGFYPWIDSTKSYYGVISRVQSTAATGEQQGYASAQCGRLIRHAWMSGVEQTQPLPTN